MNFAQLIHTETKKAVCSALKKSNCGRKRRIHHKESHGDSDSNYWSVGSDNTGDLHVVKKTKSSNSVVDTVPCPIKAIPSKNSNKPIDTPEDIGVTPSVDVMEPATENLSSEGTQILLRIPSSNKIWVLLDTGSNGDLFFHKTGKPKLLPTWLGKCQSLGIHQMGPSTCIKGANSEENSLTILQAGSTWYNLILWSMMEPQWASQGLTSFLVQIPWKS